MSEELEELDTLDEGQYNDILVDDIKITLRDKSEIMRMPIDDIIEMARYGDKNSIYSIRRKLKSIRCKYREIEYSKNEWKNKALTYKKSLDTDLKVMEDTANAMVSLMLNLDPEIFKTAANKLSKSKRFLIKNYMSKA